MLQRDREVTNMNSKDQFEALVAKARLTNASRDAMDRKKGLAAPPDLSVWDRARTALFALESAMRTAESASSSWDCVAEAYIFIEAVEKQLRPLYPHSVHGGGGRTSTSGAR
jgi:hypothetical protein